MPYEPYGPSFRPKSRSTLGIKIALLVIVAFALGTAAGVWALITALS